MQSTILNDLIMAAYSGAVFGPGKSFGLDVLRQMPVVLKQIESIGDIFYTELDVCIRKAMPDWSDSEVRKIMKEIGPKAVSFCPALTAGELTGKDDIHRLAAAASAIGVMYFADQSMDRGDETMVAAIEELCGYNPIVSQEDTSKVHSRLAALQHIESNVNNLALTDDAPFVLDCYNKQVLYNEVLLHKLSLEYLQLESTDKQQEFLGRYAEQLAMLMVIDAGFPSVTASLYAIYRQNDSDLLPLSVVHADENILKILRICNTVVRIADEVGDWEIDAGHHPEWGTFSINPFNQYHPAIVFRLCELAYIQDDALVASLQQAFREFHTSKENTERYGKYITDTFFNHIRGYINELPGDVVNMHSRYITLCKRVLEIGSVNIMGDKALADTTM